MMKTPSHIHSLQREITLDKIKDEKICTAFLTEIQKFGNSHLNTIPNYYT